MKSCSTCRYCDAEEPVTSLPRCLHPNLISTITDYYSGTERANHPIVEFARAGQCGHEGRLWEARSDG